MTKFQNGRIPAPGQPGSPLQTIATGTDWNGYWEFQISAHTLAWWNAAKAYAQSHFGRTLHIRTGWNCYRPWAVQDAARKRAEAQGIPNSAASPGYSSHGGTWIDAHFTGGVWVDAMAIDVDPNGLTWAQVWEACTAAGFLCNAITIQRAGIEEPWHIIDLHPWDAVPADVNAHPFPLDTPAEEYDMPIHIRRETTGDSWTVQPHEYIKHHPDVHNGDIANYLTTGLVGRTDFRSLNDADLILTMWDMGFDELEGDLTRLPVKGATYHRPTSAVVVSVSPDQTVIDAIAAAVRAKLAADPLK